MGRTTRLGRRVLDQRGMALTSPVALLSAGAVVVAGVAFLTTGSDQPEPQQSAAPVASSAQPSVTPVSKAPEPVIREKREKKPKPPKSPPVKRGETYVEVYNNSGISGLAGSTAARAQGAGWQVVGSDNWYGTIPASTVYYPARLSAEAKLLGRDLGITRLMPAQGEMRLDRLTVILTSDYDG
ncbi:LytR C-terminal domain-containing protein [Nocardioides mesophilus]|uniref:LytR C-terminal domain-containing protein n=1 Tax=Nocardioides mesophilus TaxID=433659 RepID=A0A7G9RE03_9ACTN|nr:LytR C-terminal domain-containing protein [Nocardioides mesophilus]QNN53828.1 LytR C-terminal domain-containing protein [Nocardioides mesophilus]